MRNEAITLVEWLAHHMAVGFDGFFICTNDCDDGTDEILSLLAPHFPIVHRDNPPPYAETIQKQALDLARKDPWVSAADWCLHIDADEYVNVTVGTRRIEDLTALWPEATAIALMWRFFGDSRLTHWTPGRILDDFTLCEAEPLLERAAFKTLFRTKAFKKFSVHTPKFPVEPEKLVVVNTAGHAMPTETLHTKRGSGYRISNLEPASWENAALHHYYVRPGALQSVKRHRGDANGRPNGKRNPGSSYYMMANCNEVENTSMSFYRDTALRIEEAMRAIPGVREAEARALAWVRERFEQAAEQRG